MAEYVLRCRYDVILRTHEDNFVGPRLLTYRPPTCVSFGRSVLTVDRDISQRGMRNDV